MRTYFPLIILAFCITQSTLAQKVGIGTTSPQSNLHVVGTTMSDSLKIANYNASFSKPLYLSHLGQLSTRTEPLNTSTFNSSSSVTIPSQNCTGIISQINVTGMPTSIHTKFITVKMNITHPDLSRLSVYLQKIVGSTTESICLIKQGTLSGLNLINTTFSDIATSNATSSSAPYTGTFLPNGSTSGLVCGAATTPSFEEIADGVVNPNGNWFLRVVDYVSGGSSSTTTLTINNWSISIGTSHTSTFSKENYLAKWKGGELGTSSTIYDNGNIGIGTAAPSEKFHLLGNMKLDTNFVIEFGAGNSKEINAGKIGYKKFSDGLDIVGAGTNSINRKIKLYAEDKVEMTGDLLVAEKTTTTNLTTTNLQLTNNASADKVMISDANGNAMWKRMHLVKLSGNAGQVVPLDLSSLTISYVTDEIDPDDLYPTCSSLNCNFTTFTSPAEGYYRMNLYVRILRENSEEGITPDNPTAYIRLVQNASCTQCEFAKQYATSHKDITGIDLNTVVYLGLGQQVISQIGGFDETAAGTPTYKIFQSIWSIEQIR